MLFTLLVSLSQSNRRICICNKGCHYSCPINSYDTSSTNISFKDYIFTQVQNEDEINIDFYSKQKEFIFSIESSYFDGIKVTIRALSDSKPIFLKINQPTLQNYKKIKLESNQQIVLSDLIPYSPTIPVNSRHILESSDITTIPMSVSLPRMDYSGSATCSYSLDPQSDLFNKPIGEYTNMKTVGCPSDASNSQCGVRCWGNNINYSYTFKGVKFAIYGTEDPGHGKFDVYLDGNNLTRINEHSNTRTQFKLMFSSEILNYREHTIKIASIGELYELYKFVYWPSVRAIRLNSTAFTKTGWEKETDGIGGFREFKTSNVLATLTIYCSRFWFYGLNDDNMGDLTIKYNNVTEVVNQKSATRKEGALIYESPLLDYFSITITLTSDKTTMISALYYEEPPIPISVGIVYMDTKGVDKCNYYTKTHDPIELDTIKHDLTTYGGCSINDNLDTEAAYKCGIKCWGNNAHYNYTFKGVKFALYGTYKPTHYNVSVVLDDEIIATVSESGPENGPAIIYESKLLEYGEHRVGYIGIGQANEFYKLVYWPSLRARRTNATQFLFTNGWGKESDNIGGIRQQKDSDAYAIITLQCSRFWIYGLRNNNMGPTTFNFNGKSETIDLNDNNKQEGVLIFESPELEYTAKTISITAVRNFKFNCIYYEEPPNPVITPIPISVSLNQMYNGGDIEKCESQKNKVISEGNVSYESNDFDCVIDNLNSVDAYNCGLRCYGTTMRYKYTFKGVKFAIYGTITRDNFDTSVIKLNGAELVRVNQHGKERTSYILLYESDIYPYNDYTVEIESLDSNKKYELYKLVFWPSMRVNRYNSTEFIEDGIWDRETDGIGGIRTCSGGRIVSFDKSFYSSRFWLYGSTMKWNEGFDLSYDGNNAFISANESETRVDMDLLKGSNEMPYKFINLHGKTRGNATLNCVFYTYEPYIDEYINKTFNSVLPYFDILVTANSIINEISGCEFNHILERSDYIVKLEKEIPFYNNSFNYDSDQSYYPPPVNVRYNGKIAIINCSFKNARGNFYYGLFTGILFFSKENIIEATVISCEFINCGHSDKQSAILRMENADSSLNVDNCTFKNDNPITAKVIESKCINLVVNNCKFIKTSKVSRRIPPEGEIKLPEKTFNFALTNCIFDSSAGISGYNGICYHLDFHGQATVVIENDTITNLKYDENNLYSILIDTNNTIDQLVLRNLSFIDNSCSSYTGGGSGIVLRDVKYVIFVDCKFINNKAVQAEQLVQGVIDLDRKNGDGGGIHLGLLCGTVEGAIKFDSCIFKDNKASKHGGAIAIQTLNTVEIVNCTFDSNKANYDFSSNELLFENHFNKKSNGRGGAIYINPTFHYYHIYEPNTCFNLSAYMTNVYIKDSTFYSNSAYDGYGIYVEGDDGGTEFEIEGNNFTNNYKSDPIDENDINISIRGIIASEVHTIPNDVVSKNHFTYDLERVKPHILIFVDHYGNRIPTYYFTESYAFSYSNDFSHSADFSHSVSFSNSADFTNSDAFSYSSAFTNSKTFPTKEFTKSSEFSYSDKFSPSNKFSETGQFSGSKQFSDSKEFSKSENFLPSTVFSNSIKFSESIAFTKTNAFSETQGFTETMKFSESKSFSDSKEFSSTNKFSGTNKFTFSGEFSNTYEFSKTGEFSMSTEFSKSSFFIGTQSFSLSGDFTKSSQFSHSELFTETARFSVSNKFSASQHFSASESFTQSHSFTPEIVEDPSCVVMLNDVNITLYRCSYSGEEETVLIRIIKTNFTEYYNESNGGAILIYDCGFECIGVNFTDCVSFNGAGGAIYLKNSRPLKYNVTVINTWFTRCKASYGGGCYIYSSSDVNDVLFSFCVFQFNTLNNNNNNVNKQELFGGTSLFLTAKNVNISNSKFYANKGKAGSLKIYDIFDGENQIKQLEEEKKLNSFSISSCDFVNDKDDEEISNMIYYVSGKDASEVEINDCKFKGKLSNGSHYIKGKILDKDKQKLQIKSCKFDKEDKDSVKIELVDDLIQNEMNIDLSSHINDFKEKDISSFVLYFGLFFVMAALLLYLKRVPFYHKCKEENHFKVEL